MMVIEADFKNYCHYNGKNCTLSGSNCMQNMACVNVPTYNVPLWFAPTINQ